MPSFDDLLNCVCQNNGPQRAGVQEILDTFQRSSVCTGTQCFETEADAYGLTVAPNGTQGTPTFMSFHLPQKTSNLTTKVRTSAGAVGHHASKLPPLPAPCGYLPGPRNLFDYDGEYSGHPADARP